MKFPAHKAELILTHNSHLSNYLSVREAVDEEDHGYRVRDWVSPDQMQKAIAANDCWSLQWYPDTPVGFCLLSAADLDVLLDAAVRPETKDD